jgi:hypothetical protein
MRKFLLSAAAGILVMSGLAFMPSQASAAYHGHPRHGPVVHERRHDGWHYYYHYWYRYRAGRPHAFRHG